MPPAVQQAESWQDALAKAEKARSDGRINPALAAYQRAVDSASGEPTPFLEAGVVPEHGDGRESESHGEVGDAGVGAEMECAAG